MRFAILHCPGCLNHVWVPEDRLGQTGHCPDCGAAVAAPANWPDFGMIDGPPIVRDFEEAEAVAAGAGGR